MARIAVLINRGGGAAAADPEIASTIADAFRSAGLEADVELIDGGQCEVRSRAVAERGDDMLVVGGGDGTISAAASALVGTETLLGISPGIATQLIRPDLLYIASAENERAMTR